MRNTFIIISFFLTFSSCNSTVDNDTKKSNCNADESLQKAIALMNFSVEGNVNYDSIRKSKIKPALDLLNESLKCDSNLINSYYWKTTFLIELKEYPEAMNSVNSGIKNSSHNHKLIEELYHTRGILNYKAGKIKEANNDFRKSLELLNIELENTDDDMKRIDIILNMVTLHVYLGDKESAISLIKEQDDGSDFYTQTLSSIDSISLEGLISKI